MDTLTNWCIKLDAENRDIVIQHLNEKYNVNCDGIELYYGEYQSNIRVGYKNWQTELTFEEFKTQILGEGYKSEILGTSKHNPPINKFLSELDKDTQNVFDKTLTSLADLLKYKNAKYGNSVLDPIEIFKDKCKAGDRIDDKLSRIKTSKELRKNDVSDLIGYLVLTCVENGWDNFDEFKD